MGIQGLHAQVSSWGRRRSLSEFRGLTVAVDAQAWLFRGVYSCATELALGTPTLAYLNFVVQRVELLRRFNISCVLVFDGRRSPMKRATASIRTERQRLELERGKDALHKSRLARGRGEFVQADVLEKAAAEHFGRACKVTEDMVTTCVEALKQTSGVRVVVAPYEADAQLAMLVYNGVASAVVTEDSDILVYAALCADASHRNVDIPLLTKLDSDGGLTEVRWGVQLKGAAVTLRSSVMEDQEDVEEDKMPGGAESTRFHRALRFFNGANGGRLFLQACILAGSDYSESLPGIGIVGAATLVNKFKTFPDDARLASIVRFVRRGAAAKGKKRGAKSSTLKPEDIPDDYAEQLRRAEIAFREHPVFLVDRSRVQEGLDFGFGECLHLSDALRRGFHGLSSVLLDVDGNGTCGSACEEDQNLADENLAASLVDAFDEGKEVSANSKDHRADIAQIAGQFLNRSCVAEVADGTLDPVSLKPRAPPLMALDHPTFLYSKGVKKRILEPKRWRGRVRDAENTNPTLAEVWASSEGGSGESFRARRSTISWDSYPQVSSTAGEGLSQISVEETRQAASRGCSEAMSQIFRKRGPSQVSENASLEKGPSGGGTNHKQASTTNSNPFAVYASQNEKEIRFDGIMTRKSGESSGKTRTKIRITKRLQQSMSAASSSTKEKRRKLAASLVTELASRQNIPEKGVETNCSVKKQASLAMMFRSKARGTQAPNVVQRGQHYS